MAAGKNRVDPIGDSPANRLRDGTQCDDRGERDHHRAHREPGANPVARQVRPPEQSLGTEEPLEWPAHHRPERLQEVGGGEGAADQEGQRDDDGDEWRLRAEDDEERDPDQHHPKLGHDQWTEAIRQCPLSSLARTRGVEGRGARRAPGRERRTDERDHDAHHEGREEAADRQRQADNEDGPRSGKQPDEDRSQSDAGDDPDGGPGRTKDERLAHDDPEHLARRRPDGAEQAELALTLPDGHRQRVAHEERGDHHGDEPEEDRHADHLATRRVEPRGCLLGGLDHVRLVEPGRHRCNRRRVRFVAEVEVDVAHR